MVWLEGDGSINMRLLRPARRWHTQRHSCVSKLVLRRHACMRARCRIAISRDVTVAWNGLAPGHRVTTVRCSTWADLAPNNRSPAAKPASQRPERTEGARRRASSFKTTGVRLKRRLRIQVRAEKSFDVEIRGSLGGERFSEEKYGLLFRRRGW